MRYEMILNDVKYDVVDHGNHRRSDHVMCRGTTHEDAVTIVEALNRFNAETAIEPIPQ